MEKMRKKKGDTGRAILFLAPALLLICCFTVIPIFEAVYTSFHKTQYAMVGEFVGLKNYISVMVESDGLKNIINSIVYVVLSLLLAISRTAWRPKRCTCAKVRVAERASTSTACRSPDRRTIWPKNCTPIRSSRRSTEVRTTSCCSRCRYRNSRKSSRWAST